MTKSTGQPKGRPPLYRGEPVKPKTISMPISYWEWLEAKGRNTSAAVRELIEAEMERQGVDADPANGKEINE